MNLRLNVAKYPGNEPASIGQLSHSCRQCGHRFSSCTSRQVMRNGSSTAIAARPSITAAFGGGERSIRGLFGLTKKLRHSRPLTSDMPTEAFNGCCMERLVRRSKANKSRSKIRPTISRSRSGGRPCHCAPNSNSVLSAFFAVKKSQTTNSTKIT